MEGCIDGSLAIDWIWWIERLEELDRDRELYNIHLVEKYMMNSCCCVSFLCVLIIFVFGFNLYLFSHLFVWYDRCVSIELVDMIK